LRISFDVKNIDSEGKKFDSLHSFKRDLILDLYPMDFGEKFRLALASSLREDVCYLSRHILCRVRRRHPEGVVPPWTLGPAGQTASST
jgi:hypothetical protein